MAREASFRHHDRSNHASNGVIRADELYTIDEFKKRLGIRDATLRSARRAGLCIKYLHGRAFVLGQDWIGYVTTATRHP
jgi:hypothetical protein